MVAVDVVGSTSRIVRTTALPPARRGREPAPDLGVVDGDAAAIAELVGDEGNHRDRVDRGIEPGDRARCRVAAEPVTSGAAIRRPASSRQTTSRSCSIRYWLLIGPPDARGGLPVDLADVVVGQVVAHRLELGSEPERPARTQPGIAETATPDAITRRCAANTSGYTSRSEPPSASNVQVPSPSGPCAPRRDRWESVSAAPVRDNLRVEPAPRGRRLDREVGRLRLAELDAPLRHRRRRSEWSRSRAARQLREQGRSRCCGALAAGAGRGPCRPRWPRSTIDRERDRDRPGDRQRREARRPRARSRRAATGSRGRHRGTGTVEMRGRDRVVGGVPLELGFRPELEPVTEHGGRDRDDVVGGHEVAAREPRGGLRRRRAGARHRAGLRRARRSAARACAAPSATTYPTIASLTVVASTTVRASMSSAARSHGLHVGRAWPARRRCARGAVPPPRLRRSDSRRRSWRESGRAGPRGGDRCPSYSIGFCVATTTNGSGSGRAIAVDAHLPFLHRFERARPGSWAGVRLISSASSRLVNTGPGRKASSTGPECHGAGQVGRQHVGRELHAAELDTDRARERVGDQGLGDAGHAFEQQVAADGHRREQHLNDAVLADDDLANLSHHTVAELVHVVLPSCCDKRETSWPSASAASSSVGGCQSAARSDSVEAERDRGPVDLVGRCVGLAGARAYCDAAIVPMPASTRARAPDRACVRARPRAHATYSARAAANSANGRSGGPNRRLRDHASAIADASEHDQRDLPRGRERSEPAALAVAVHTLDELDRTRRGCPRVRARTRRCRRPRGTQFSSRRRDRRGSRSSRARRCPR